MAKTPEGKQHFIQQAFAYKNSGMQKPDFFYSINEKRKGSIKQIFSNYSLARKQGAFLKNQAIENLDKYLKDFEINFSKNGGKLLWATDGEEAKKDIYDILNKKNIRTCLRGQKEIEEEIHLDGFLEDQGIEMNTLNLEEFIANNKASFGTETDQKKLYHSAENLMAQKIQQSEALIVSADFLATDTGSVCISNNNKFLTKSLGKVKTLIFVAGIEKLIPSIYDLHLFLPLLSTAKTGEPLQGDTHIISGTGVKSFQEIYLIFIDNGRSNLLDDLQLRSALNCIGCQACESVCPVYQQSGAEAYNSHRKGPIGAVVNMHIGSFQRYKHQSYASTLCGACSDVCPVKIDLQTLLIVNRNKSFQIASKKVKLSVKLFQYLSGKRKRINRFGGTIRKIILGFLLKETWGHRGGLPDITPRSFNQLWKDRNDFS
ncbi:MAG: LUD domain-containing protein [Cytophagaceae bacterium]